jgi:opacity protein-like surface antigen
MAKFKAVVLASGAALAASLLTLPGIAVAADLLPPPPPLEPAPLAAPDFGGWYLRGDVGVGMAVGNSAVTISPSPLLGAPADAFNSFYNPTLSASALFDVGIGYQINNWLRMDATVGYRGGSHFQALEQVGIPSTASQFADFYRGDVSSWVGMVNGYVDVGTWYGITPYVGAGIGVAQNTVSGVTDTGFAYPGAGLGGFPTGGYLDNGSKTNFAWGLMTGVAFNVTQNLKLDLGYRYLNLGKFTSGSSHCFNGTAQNGGFSAANCGGSGYTIASTSNLASSDFLLGLRWMIGDATPVYAPPPAPLVRKY